MVQLTDITADSINAYIVARDDEGAAPKTVMLEIGTLRATLRKHRLWEPLLPDLELPTVNNEIGRALSSAERARLLEACAVSRSRSLLCAVGLDLSSGLRYSELRLLRWSQIDFDQRRLRVGKSKTPSGEGRPIALNDQAFSLLSQWAANFPDRRPEHFVFPAEKYGEAGPYATDVMRPIGSWKTAWETAKKRAGVKCRFHDLRHSACSRMLEAGVPFSLVAEIMGWAASTMVLMAKRYGHSSEEARSQAVKHLDGTAGVGWLQNSLQSDGKASDKIQ